MADWSRPRRAVKRPVEVSAWEVTDEKRVRVAEWCKGRAYKNGLAIPTPEGVMTCRVGDFVIEGVAGEFYPCRGDIFRASYDFPFG